jgi:LacI family transcriptional regulator
MLIHVLSRMRRVALIYDATMAYDLRVIGGVAAYLQEGTKWNVYIEENALKDQRLPDLGAWEGDGIIANLDHPNVAMAVVKSKLPTVGFGSGYGWYAPESHIPYFFTNNQAIARLAADHLLERGLRNFAYCGYPRTLINGWSEEREREFAERVRVGGFPCQIYRGRHRNSRRWVQIQRALCAWLVSLPKPTGLMAANDNRARQVLEACRVSGLRVPEEVAVIGVDNDEVLCRLSSPLLTSIEQGAARIGYEAAALLDRMISGKRSDEKRYVVDPAGVVTRLSTDVLPVEDSQVAKAMSFIREHACDGIKVPQVVAAVAASRSGLEARFKTALGRTLHTAIRDVQLERVKRLFTETNLAAKEIAASTGFKSVQHMSSLFRQAFGLPPAAYRRRVVSTFYQGQAPRQIAAKHSAENS